MQHAFGSLDVGNVAASLTGLALFGGAVWAGVRKALKELRSGEAEAGSKITGGVIMDNVSMAMLSERLRESAEATRESTPAMRELAHQTERLRDELARRG